MVFFCRITLSTLFSKPLNNYINLWKEPPVLKMCHFNIFENLGFGVENHEILVKASQKEQFILRLGSSLQTLMAAIQLKPTGT